MKQKILISWVGINDIRGVKIEAHRTGERGPLLTLLEHFGENFFDRIFLFHTSPQEGQDGQDSPLLMEPEALHYAPVQMHDVGAIAPTDLKAIYDVMSLKLKEFPTQAELYYALSSGSPAMYAASLSLSMFQFPGNAWYSIEKRFAAKEGKQVFSTSFPYALSTLSGEGLVDEESFVAEVNKKVYAQAKEKVARTDATVLILGETGVGKTHLAKQIHLWSGLPKDIFVAVNCAEVAGDHNLMRSELFGHKKGSFTGAINDKEGAFERADGGTLFLDEIGEIPLELQGMFLRTLEEGEILPLGENSYRKVKVRIIAATNKNLAEEMQDGRFRKDLYYRIANYAPRLSALRAYNHADKEQLLQFLLGKINEKYHSSQPRILCAQAKNLLLQATWPGNIREMAYRLQSICLLSDSLVTAEDVQEQMSMDALLSYVKKPAFDDDFIPNNLTQWLDEHKLLFIERAKAQCKTEKAAAQRLGMDQGTMRSFMKKYKKESDI